MDLELSERQKPMLKWKKLFISLKKYTLSKYNDEFLEPQILMLIIQSNL